MGTGDEGYRPSPVFLFRGRKPCGPLTRYSPGEIGAFLPVLSTFMRVQTVSSGPRVLPRKVVSLEGTGCVPRHFGWEHRGLWSARFRAGIAQSERAIL